MILKIEFPLTEARESAKMTQTELARFLGVPRQRVYHLERSKALPRLRTVEGIINALEIKDINGILRIVEK